MEKFDIKSRKWVNYISRFRQYLITNKIDSSLYVPNLISSVDGECYELMVNLCKPKKPEEKSFEELVEIVKNHMEPTQSVVARRHVFRHRYQKEDEDITKYVEVLRQMAGVCEFEDKYEENIRDQLASGVSRDDIRERLFSESNLTYESALKISLAMETAKRCSTVDKCTSKIKDVKNRHNSCWRCGRLPHHDPEECRYQQFQCNICNEIGHLEKMCPEDVRVKNFVRRRNYSRKENRFSKTANNVRIKVINKRV